MFSMLVKLKENAAEPKQEAVDEKIHTNEQNVPVEQVKQPDTARKPDIRQEPPVPVEPPAVQAGADVGQKEVKQKKDVPAALQHDEQQVGMNPLCYRFTAGSFTPSPSLSEKFNRKLQLCCCWVAITDVTWHCSSHFWQNLILCTNFTPWSRSQADKLIAAQLIIKFSTFWRT